MHTQSILGVTDDSNLFRGHRLYPNSRIAFPAVRETAVLLRRAQVLQLIATLPPGRTGPSV